MQVAKNPSASLQLHNFAIKTPRPYPQRSSATHVVFALNTRCTEVQCAIQQFPTPFRVILKPRNYLGCQILDTPETGTV